MIRKTIITIYILALSISIHAKVETYKIACLNDYYPYSAVNSDNELEGILIDWWKVWAKKAGAEVIFVPTDIQGCVDKLQNNEVDIIAGLFFNEERASKFDFSDYILRMQAILFLKVDYKTNSLDELQCEIGVVKNDLAHLYLQEKYPQLNLLVFNSFSALRYSINKKDLSAFIYAFPNPINGLKGYDDPNGYYKYQTLFTNKLRPMVKKGNQEMLNIIISSTNDISNAELIKIAKKWKIFEENSNIKQITVLLGVLLLCIIALLYWFLIKQKRKNKELSELDYSTDWQVIIDKGENDSIEFKSSLRWDYRQDKPNKTLEQVIVKTISAFLNTEGGMLFIGVDDEGNTLGLDNDYSSFSKKNSDGFLLTLTNLINQNLGKSTHKFITVNIIAINDKDVCIVNIEKSDKPVFLGKNDKEEFYIRASASSQPMGLKDAYAYISSHWS